MRDMLNQVERSFNSKMVRLKAEIDTVDVLELYSGQSIVSVGDDGDLEIFYEDSCVEFSDSDII
jgi:hypothetical protein